MHSDLLVSLVKVVDLLGTQTAVQLLQCLTLLEVRLLELKWIGFADCQIAQAVILEGSENKIWLLRLL